MLCYRYIIKDGNQLCEYEDVYESLRTEVHP